MESFDNNLCLDGLKCLKSVNFESDGDHGISQNGSVLIKLFDIETRVIGVFFQTERTNIPKLVNKRQRMSVVGGLAIAQWWRT